jgi:hypothetical protein
MVQVMIAGCMPKLLFVCMVGAVGTAVVLSGAKLLGFLPDLREPGKRLSVWERWMLACGVAGLALVPQVGYTSSSYTGTMPSQHKATCKQELKVHSPNPKVPLLPCMIVCN